MNISMNEKRPILKNRFYLYLTEFFSGMSVMAVELGASRLMVPYFSDTWYFRSSDFYSKQQFSHHRWFCSISVFQQ